MPRLKLTPLTSLPWLSALVLLPLVGAGSLMLFPSRAERRFADRTTGQRTGKNAVQHPTAESRLLCILLIDVQRVRIADQARRQHKMRIGNRHSCAEFVADFDFVIAFARKHRHAAHSQLA